MTFRPFDWHDLARGLELSSMAGWNQTAADWQFLLDQPIHNNWVAEESNAVIGTAMSLFIPPETMWIGMVLVHPDHRGQGIGRRLMRKILDNCTADTIRLDASAMGFELYKKIGFKIDEQITRYVRAKGSSRPPVMLGQSTMLQPKNLPAVHSYDKVKSGLQRADIINYICQHGTGMLFHHQDEIKGYALARAGQKTHHIGPVIADNILAATTLIAALVDQFKTLPFSIDVFDRHAEIVQLLENLGFEKGRSFYRMSYKKPGKSVDTHMYCSFDPAMS